MNAIFFYEKLLVKNPITTKAISAFGIFGAGDYLCQEMENRILKLGNKINFKRIFKQASFGIVVAPYLHLQFCVIIPRLYPEGSKLFLLKSILYAVLVSDAIFNFSFFYYMSTIKNKEEKNSTTEVIQKFIPVQIMNMKVWPFLTGFNFYFIPTIYRVLFDNFACMFWNIYLSYVENNKCEKNIEINLYSNKSEE